MRNASDNRLIGRDDQLKMALGPADIAGLIALQLAHVQIAEMMILPVNRY